MDFTIKQGDNRSALKATLYNASGSVVDLTNTIVKFVLSDQANKLLEKDATVIDAEKGLVWVQFEKPDLINISGVLRGEIKVTFDDNRTETFPNDSYIKVHVLRSL